MSRPTPRQVFDDPQSHWAYLTQTTDDDFEGHHFDRKEAGRYEVIEDLTARRIREYEAGVGVSLLTFRSAWLAGTMACCHEMNLHPRVTIMLNAVAKPLLVSTSLSPVLLAFGINSVAEGKGPWEYAPWFAASVSLLGLCLLILRFSKMQLEKQNLQVKSIKNSDKEVMTFLLAYLLPLVPARTLGFSGHLATGIFVFGMFFLAIYYSNAFDFNPLLGLCGYHFYEVQSADGMSFLLITGSPILKPEHVAEVVQLFPYTFLAAGRSK